MKIKIVLIVIICQITVIHLGSSNLPVMHSSIMLDFKKYEGNNANNDFYDNTDRFQIRKTAVAFEGRIKEKYSYDVEFGISTCVGSGTQLKLLDAGIFYNFGNDFKVGLQQGHVLRGFAGSTECTARITMEKPTFLKTFAICHPTGLVLNKYFAFGNYSGLEAEIALMNGTNGTLDGEHDYNFGLIYHTPISGLSFTSVYNHTAKNYLNSNYEKYSEAGYRIIGGIKYEAKSIFFTAESYRGKGFSYDEQIMNAHYFQIGYSFKNIIKELNYIQPFAQYSIWEKDEESNSDTNLNDLNLGLNVSFTENIKLKLNYQKILENPEDEENKPDSFVTRLQLSF